MNKKKILIVSRAFYPMNSPRSFRTTELAKELSRQGHEITVLTKRTENQNKILKNFKIQIIDLDVPTKKNMTSFLNIGIASGLIHRVLNRLQSQLFYYPDILLKNIVYKALKKININNFDAIISIAVPHSIHWGVSKYFKKKGNNLKVVWIADCGDPFMLADSSKNYFRPFYFKWLEKRFCRQCNYITVPAQVSINGYYEEFHEKIEVIPQGFRFEDTPKASKSFSNKKNIVYLAYGGSLNNHSRNPRDFIGYLNNLDIEYRFYIFSNDHQIISSISDVDTNSVIVKKKMDRLSLLKFLQKMDFVVNFENTGHNHLPSKLIDYAIIEKPILSVKAFDLDENMIQSFMKGDYSEALVIDNKDSYRIENVAESFINLISNG